jgi:hypothetical protein
VARAVHAQQRNPDVNDVSDQIREHMTIVASDGGHVGTVDGLEGNRILVEARGVAQRLQRGSPAERDRQ